MHATIRRYEGVDQDRATELEQGQRDSGSEAQQAPGFAGYYLIEAGGASSAHSVFLRQPSRVKSLERPCDLDSRRETRDVDPQRAEDHDRRGRCSQ